MNRVSLTAPASKILTVLHVVDPGAEWVEDLVGDGSTNGSTMCGIPMRTADSWQLLEQMPGEKICAKCTGEGFSTDDEQETLL